MSKLNSIYVIGSLRNEAIPEVSESLRALGLDVFDDWFAAGPEADDYWKKYEVSRGHSYKEALRGHAARHVFEFDKHHLDRCDAAVLILPAGRSGHLELGYVAGTGKPSFILLDGEDSRTNLTNEWSWFSGLFEGEGSVGTNGKNSIQLQLTSTDEDVIDKIIRVTGVGKKQGPYLDKGLNFKIPPKNIKPKYRWAVYKKNEILQIGWNIFDNLGVRRQEQWLFWLNKRGWLNDFNNPPKVGGRWDVMYQFATEVFVTKEEMFEYFK